MEFLKNHKLMIEGEGGGQILYFLKKNSVLKNSPSGLKNSSLTEETQK